MGGTLVFCRDSELAKLIGIDVCKKDVATNVRGRALR